MKFLICIFFPLFLFSQKDKTGFDKHYFAGALISSHNAVAINHFTKGKRFPAVFFGSLSGIIAGYTKEKYDASIGKKFSNDDFIMTSFGSVVYIGAFFFVTEELKNKKQIDTTIYNNLSNK